MNNYKVKQKNRGQKCKTWGCHNTARIKGLCHRCYERNNREVRV